jgi:signal transduction histidine kinase
MTLKQTGILRWCALTVAIGLWCRAGDVRAETSAPAALAPRILTNIVEIWQLPRSEREQPYRMRTEMLIYYVDTEWHLSFGECQGKPTWLCIGDCPYPVKAGQQIALEGVITPTLEHFDWSNTTIRVLKENVELNAEAATNLIENAQQLKAHLISFSGLVDGISEDERHTTLQLMTKGLRTKVYVLKDAPGKASSLQIGDEVRIKCVFTPQFDRAGNAAFVTLLVARPTDVEVVNSLNTDERFNLPMTTSAGIGENTPSDKMIHVAGMVRSHDPGKSVTIWDEAGQILICSEQMQPLHFGDPIEAVGYPVSGGMVQRLNDALYRPDQRTNAPSASMGTNGAPAIITLAERIREMSLQQAQKNQPVSLRGMILWSHPDTPFVYVEDASGGVRVDNPRWRRNASTQAGTLYEVRGNVTPGEYVPEVTNAIMNRFGYAEVEDGPMVTFEDAMTGTESGRWVTMRGYVRDVSTVKGLSRLDFSTSGGEFSVWTPFADTFAGMKGSVVRAQGVCEVIADSRHRLTGVQLWSPETRFIYVEERAPDDVFALPLYKMDSLRRFDVQNSLSRRVHTEGTVLLQAPGSHLYLQDGDSSLFVLTRDREPLELGDRVEVVGLAGNEGRGFLLREATYRKIGKGAEAKPVRLGSYRTVNPEFGGLLATGTGAILNLAENNRETHLLIKGENASFEAVLPRDGPNAGGEAPKLELGSTVAVTGVYEIQSDEYGRPRSFVLRLRSGNDINLIKSPPWWTFAKLLWVLLGFAAISMLVSSWAIVNSRKNALLRQAQGELQKAHDELEVRVDERTLELRLQVEAREKAHKELREAQQTLIQASHKAGMAEVATGVLHNVGNVLNSVNVSATLLSQRMKQSRVEFVGKAAATIMEQNGHLAEFLSNDPKGRALPGYLQKLGESLVEEKRSFQEELKNLSGNIEHIKAIVSMQQNYAKLGGIIEELAVEDVVEDAIRLNGGSLENHSIELARDFHPVPRIVSDKHKLLQILVNLVSNAKHAVKEKESGRKITMRIEPAPPDCVRISVIDNGAGIAPENLLKIFNQGFTTRKDGHGFGLHSGANAAKQLGGSLNVQSEGLGLGAAFVLTLPVNPSAKNPQEKS